MQIRAVIFDLDEDPDAGKCTQQAIEGRRWLTLLNSNLRSSCIASPSWVHFSGAPVSRMLERHHGSGMSLGWELRCPISVENLAKMLWWIGKAP